MLQGDWLPEDTHDIDFANLPRVPLRHTVVSDVHPEGCEPGRETLYKDQGARQSAQLPRLPSRKILGDVERRSGHRRSSRPEGQFRHQRRRPELDRAEVSHAPAT